MQECYQCVNAWTRLSSRTRLLVVSLTIILLITLVVVSSSGEEEESYEKYTKSAKSTPNSKLSGKKSGKDVPTLSKKGKSENEKTEKAYNDGDKWDTKKGKTGNEEVKSQKTKSKESESVQAFDSPNKRSNKPEPKAEIPTKQKEDEGTWLMEYINKYVNNVENVKEEDIAVDGDDDPYLNAEEENEGDEEGIFSEAWNTIKSFWFGSDEEEEGEFAEDEIKSRLIQSTPENKEFAEYEIFGRNFDDPDALSSEIFVKNPEALEALSHMCEPDYASRDTRATFVFTTISRTAGSAVRQTLEKFAEKCNVQWNDFRKVLDEEKENRCNLKKCILSDDAKEKLLATDILTGNQQFGMHSLLPSIVYGTIIRNPIHTFVSVALNVERKKISRKHKKEKSKKLIEEYSLKKSHSAIRDALEEMRAMEFPFRADLMWRLTARFPSLETIDRDTEILQENLEQFELIGLAEHYELTIDILKKMLDPQGNAGPEVWDTVYTNVSPFSQTTKEVVKLLPQDLREEIEEYVKYEMEVYQYAKNLFHSQCIRWINDSRCDEIMRPDPDDFIPQDEALAKVNASPYYGNQQNKPVEPKKEKAGEKLKEKEKETKEKVKESSKSNSNSASKSDSKSSQTAASKSDPKSSQTAASKSSPTATKSEQNTDTKKKTTPSKTV